MTARQLPPLDALRKKIDYDSITGQLKRVGKQSPLGYNGQGYVGFYINGQWCQGHRVAWALYHNELPDPHLEIDHIDGNPSNNRIENLRLVTQSENLRNKNPYKNCKHGYPGIIHEKGRTKCWRAQIGINGTIKKLGSFRCKTAAIIARKQGEIRHGFTGRSGDAKWQL